MNGLVANGGLLGAGRGGVDYDGVVPPSLPLFLFMLTRGIGNKGGMIRPLSRWWIIPSVSITRTLCPTACRRGRWWKRRWGKGRYECREEDGRRWEWKGGGRGARRW